MACSSEVTGKRAVDIEQFTCRGLKKMSTKTRGQPKQEDNQNKRTTKTRGQPKQEDNQNKRTTGGEEGAKLLWL